MCAGCVASVMKLCPEGVSALAVISAPTEGLCYFHKKQRTVLCSHASSSWRYASADGALLRGECLSAGGCLSAWPRSADRPDNGVPVAKPLRMP